MTSKLGWKQIDPGVVRMVVGEADDHPRWADKQNLKGLALLLEARDAAARACFDRCLEINPEYRWAVVNRIQAVALAAGSPEARNALAEAGGLDATDRDLLEAFLALVEGAPEPGLRALDRLPRTIRDSVMGGRLEAALRGFTDPGAAKAVWEGVVARFPELEAVDAAPWEAAGGLRIRSFLFGAHQLFAHACVLEGRLGRMERAAATAVLAFVYWSDRGLYRHQLGFLKSLGGNPDEAVAFYEEASRLSPEEPRAHIALAYHWSASGERDRAEAALRDALARAPGYADLHYQMGLLQRAGSDLEGALVSTRNALAINPNYMVARLEEAELLFALRRWKEARDAYDSVLSAGLRSSDMYLRLGQIEDELENLPAAREAYENALRLNPQDPLVHYYMGKLHQRQGERDHAVDAWKRFVVLNEEEQDPGTAGEPPEDGD
jgi:tetratricopeptide (TPR) repeat protein